MPPAVACLQTHPRFGRVEENLDRAEAGLAGRAADLLVLPELFATGYAFRDRAEAAELAEAFPDGLTTRRLCDWSRRLGGAVVVAGFVEREGDHLYNAAAIVSGGEARHCYRKLHLFGFESEVFDPGDGELVVVEHEGLRVGVMVCFDWIFPESARVLALLGADVIAHPSNLVLPFCQQAMPIRALENGVYTATANRVGVEERPPRPRLAFTGGSVIAGPDGRVLAAAPTEGEAWVEAPIDPERARDKTLASGNDRLGERRPDKYALLGRFDPPD